MVDKNHALVVMGNHEYNAIAYAHEVEPGNFLRSHNEMHAKQHSATMEQFAHYQDEWQDWLKWFYQHPLYLDLGDIRIVHACWDQEHIDWLSAKTGGRLTTDLLIDAHNKSSSANTVIEETLKGV